MTTVEFGFRSSSDDYPHFVLIDHLIHQVSSNDEVERSGVASTRNETGLSQSSTPSLAHRSRDPAIARADCYARPGYRVTWHSTALSLTFTHPAPDRAK